MHLYPALHLGFRSDPSTAPDLWHFLEAGLHGIHYDMLILFILCLCIAAWGSNSVVVEVAKRRPREPLFSIQNRYEADAYIWSDAAPLSLRRRYIMCMACAPLGLLCLARLVWMSELDPDRRLIGIGLAGLFALIITSSLTIKVIRHGL